MVKSRKAVDWLSMAQEDLEDALNSFESGRYAASVFHAELASQKAVKALIAGLGFEPGKTHRPTVVLKALILGGLISLEDHLMEEVNKIISYAIVLEDQGTTPRYGWETVDRIIKPSEIYSKEISESLLKSSEKVVELVENVLRRIDC